MNIFYLHSNPATAARAMTDKHVVKMILESAQLLSTAHRYLDGTLYTELSAAQRKLKRWRLANDSMDQKLYKATHVNHPSGIWTRESADNYLWLYFHFIALCEEYTARYGKTHATKTLLMLPLAALPKNIPHIGPTPLRLAITNTAHHVANDPIQSYRNYYVAEKLKTPKDIERYNNVLGFND